MRLTILIIAILLSSNCEPESHHCSEWEIVYKHDENGNLINGDKSLLIEAVRLGYPIRVGFGRRSTNDTLLSIEHIADAEFLTIANGKEGFAQNLSPK